MPDLEHARPSTIRAAAWRTAYRLGFPLARIWWRLRRQRHEGALVAVHVGPALLLVRSSYRIAWNFPGGTIRRGETRKWRRGANWPRRSASWGTDCFPRAPPDGKGADQSLRFLGEERFPETLSALERVAVDTHGFTYFAMALAKLVGFDLCPRLAGLKTRRLYLPKGLEVPHVLRPIVAETVSRRTIGRGWEGLLRLSASVTTVPAGRMMMQMLGAFAEYEREMVKERTQAVQSGPRARVPWRATAEVHSGATRGNPQHARRRPIGGRGRPIVPGAPRDDQPAQRCVASNRGSLNCPVHATFENLAENRPPVYSGQLGRMNIAGRISWTGKEGSTTRRRIR